MLNEITIWLKFHTRINKELVKRCTYKYRVQILD